MKNILAVLFAGCLGMSLVAVGFVVTADSSAAVPVKKAVTRAHDDGSDIIDAAIQRQLIAARARVQAARGEALAFNR